MICLISTKSRSHPILEMAGHQPSICIASGTSPSPGWQGILHCLASQPRCERLPLGESEPWEVLVYALTAVLRSTEQWAR